VQARGIYIASLDCNNNNYYGNDNDECQQQGLGCKCMAFTSRCVMATTTATMAMTTTNVNKEALGVSARHFYIASCDSDNNSNYGDDDNKCQQQGHGRKRTAFLHCVTQRPRRQYYSNDDDEC
jgi:hypothetical protein